MVSDPFSNERLDVTLKELVDLPSLRELVVHFQQVYGLGVIVFDPQGSILLENCSMIPEMAQSWPTIPSQLHAYLPKRGAEREASFLDKTFVILPIVSNLETVGAIAMGPRQESRMEKDRFREVARFIHSVVEVLVFSAYKRYVTNFAHIESITESYRQLEVANRELQSSYEQLKEIDRIKSNFLAIVSHELRTPLTSVIGYSEMLLEGIGGNLTDQQKNYVHVIMEKGEQLLGLIREILNLTKIEAGQMRLSVQSVSIRDVADSAVATIRPQAVKKSIDVRNTIATEVPMIVQIDREKVIQILNNLLSNAVKFTDQGSVTLEIGLCHAKRFSLQEKDKVMEGSGKKDFMFLTVADTGVGIPEDHVEKVFQKFYQVDDSSTRAYGGTGLGLTIAKSFVEMHGGEIWVESILKKGTRITFTLPLNLEGAS